MILLITVDKIAQKTIKNKEKQTELNELTDLRATLINLRTLKY